MMKNKWKITAAAILGTAGILTAGYLYWCTTLDDKVIWKDVSINWVALQGKTIEAAEKAVQEQFKKDYQDSEITVSLAEKNYEVKIFPVLSLNASREIREAYRPGHGKWYVRGMDKIKLKDQEPVSLEILPKASEPEKLKEAEKQLKQADEGADVRISFAITEPELSTEQLTSMLYRDVLGSYTTYGGGSSGRIANIQLACGSCNDVILNPGDIFSYNDTVGERTIERGFQSAPVIANGQLVPGIGGGICQVSSTLYAACLNAGLEIVERYPHSKPVAYIPSGMDATVSWGILDYKFKNNTEYPVKIQDSYANGAIFVQILGTREG